MSLSSAVSSSDRAVGPTTPFGDVVLWKARGRASSRYIAIADVSRCYPSIYTHSLAWATMGKAAAKVSKSGGLGNDLDRAVRDAQDGQTVGLPIGPDTSFVLAELLLAERDEALRRLLPWVRGFRSYDDYEFHCTTRSEAETVIATLQSVLAEVELSLNPSKTGVHELPQSLEKSWVAPLRRLRIRTSATGFGYDLIDYFDEVFRLAALSPDDSVVAYSLSRIARQSPPSASWPLFQQLLLQATNVEPGVLGSVVPILAWHVAGGAALDRDLVASVLSAHVVQQVPLGHHSEVAWALWGAICLDVALDAAATTSLAGSSDDFVTLLALDAEARGRLTGPLDRTAWLPEMTGDQLRDERWLLAFEALGHGWLPSATGSDYVSTDLDFGVLRRSGVSFYDVAAECFAPATPRARHLSSMIAALAAGRSYGAPAIVPAQLEP